MPLSQMLEKWENGENELIKNVVDKEAWKYLMISIFLPGFEAAIIDL